MSEPQALYRVTVEIDFAYGHRLLDYDGKCAHPHGHNARVEIELEAPSLDRADMVVDFTELKHQLRAWLDEHVDHKMILRRDDPLVPVLQDFGEPVFLMDTNPTAERLAQLLYEVADQHRFPVSRVRFWESPTSSAEFVGPSAHANDGGSER